MPKRTAFHRQVFERLRAVGDELPSVAWVSRGREVVERQVEHHVEAVVERVGGWTRTRVVALLAAVLAVSTADTGAISAIAPNLERSLHIGNVEIGLLVTVSGLTAAAGMLPAGWVTDRRTRTRLVTIAVAVWGVAELISALSPDYLFLLVVRLALGMLTAVTGPTLASLTGDLFPARERSEIFGFILAGELLGAGLGLLIAGLVTAWATWRVALAVLSVPSSVLAWQFHRRLPEPARGGQSRLERGAETLVAASDVEGNDVEGNDVEAALARPGPAHPVNPASSADPAEPARPVAGAPESRAGALGEAPRPDETGVLREVRRRRVDPRKGVLLDQDPMELGWWESFRYVVAVRSNLTLIVASALGYFFFTGAETFALIFMEGHYRVGQAAATLVALGVGGAGLVGAVAGGRITDLELERGHIEARLVVPAAAFILAALVFVPAVLTESLVVAVPFFLLAGFCIAVPNPGLDAARLDIMPSRMWGRAEAVRSFLRSALQSMAPLVFGFVSTFFGGKESGLGASGGTHGMSADAVGLPPTFLLMLVALLAAAGIAWKGRRPYPIDIAAAAETERRFPPLKEVPEPSAPPGRHPLRPGRRPPRPGRHPSTG
jgi:MFS family permease